MIFLASVFLFTTVGFKAEGGSARADLEQEGYTYTKTSFVECAKKGDMDVVKLFLAEGIDINACDEKGRTALMRAVEYQRTEVVTLLLEKGADVNFTKAHANRTAFMEAASSGNRVIIKQLAEKGAKINVKDNQNYTPLHYACTWGHVEAVKLLIELGANPEIRNIVGVTAMMIAKQNGHTEVVKVLKDKGVIMVDSGDPKKSKAFLKGLEKASINPDEIKLIILTHGHWDHIGSAAEIKKITGAKVVLHQNEKHWLEQSLKPMPPGVTTWGKISTKLFSWTIVPLVHIEPTTVDIVLKNEMFSLNEYGISGSW